MTAQTKESQTNISPQNAIELLKEGNERFIKNQKVSRNLLEQVAQTAEGQFPFAVVLSCIDSRVPTEIVFDQGIGDIFNIRIAGNFVNEDILGSMEFACKAAGSKLIVVMGHSSCGAIKGACDHVELGNLTGLLKKLEPAVDAIESDDRTSGNAEFVQKVADKNVALTIDAIKSGSPVLNEMLNEGSIKLVGAMYSVESGKVEFNNI